MFSCTNDNSYDYFRDIVASYRQLVYSTCRHRLANDADVEEAVQEVFLSLAENSDQIEKSLGGWLRGCATNTANNRIRSQRQRTKREAEYARVTSPGQSRQQTDLNEIAAVFDHCLGELDDDEKQLIIKYFFLNMTQSQIAEQTNQTQPDVSRLLTNIVDRLGDMLRKHGLAFKTAGTPKEKQHDFFRGNPRFPVVFQPDAYKFTKIAESGPDFQINGHTFALNNKGTIAYMVDGPDGGTIYLADVVDGQVETHLPHRFQYDKHVAIALNDKGVVAMHKGEKTIGVIEDGKFTALAEDGFIRSHPAINNSGDIVYNTEDNCLCLISNREVKKLYDTSDSFTWYGSGGINDSGLVAFYARQQGFYKGVFTGSGQKPNVIAEYTGGTGGFGPLVDLNNNGTVVFLAAYETEDHELLIGDGGEVISIANTEGDFEHFCWHAINNAGQVGFLAQHLKAAYHRRAIGLFFWDGKVIQAVLTPGQELFGHEVDYVDFWPKCLNDAGQMVLYVNFGSKAPSAIVLVEPVR